MNFNRNKLRFALLMSWRETRAAAGKFAFLVAGHCARHGSADGRHRLQRVRASHAVSRSALADGGGYVRATAAPPASGRSSTRSRTWNPKAFETTRVTETVSMASSGSHFPVLVSVKGADFSRYPFYGRPGTGSAGNATRRANPSAFPTTCC